MIRHCACIITNDKVLLGNPNEQHRDIIINNNLQRDEDIIGYYDFHLPNLFIGISKKTTKSLVSWMNYC